ncbi:MAG: class I SAM-dependent methyltransferase [Candidatus Latescibacterota bacterium]|nr:MAG: class I SAM-dependent methyltransferase [Candidatus Latescibacterota bacterium]
MDSTSIHRLNADRPLRYYRKLLWVGLNLFNNRLLPNASGQNLVIRDFIADTSDEKWCQTDIKSSPSRKLSDLFWLQLPWGWIKSELGSINILDTGCGSGDYGVKLQSFSNGRITSYTGVDIAPNDNWQVLTDAHPNFRFHTMRGEQVLDRIPEETNFIMSQSAIEHFENDLLYFKNLREFIRQKSSGIVQVHLFPSAACLFLYRLHGVRQYTPRTVSSITRLFEPFSYSVLFRLGGRQCNSLHKEFITKPVYIRNIEDSRDTRTEEYDSRLREAIANDNASQRREAAFYALVIHSHYREKFFENADSHDAKMDSHS